jgi:hypothetical protein
VRWAVFCIALLMAGCGGTSPQTNMIARDWRYYVANPGEIEPMQKICREWAGSTAPSEAQPAVVTGNCRAAAFAKSQLRVGQPARQP